MITYVVIMNNTNHAHTHAKIANPFASLILGHKNVLKLLHRVIFMDRTCFDQNVSIISLVQTIFVHKSAHITCATCPGAV